MTILKKTTALSTLALALAACGDDVAEDPVVGSEMADVETAATAEYDPMTRDYALSDDAQTRRDAFDADAFRSEYDGYRDEVAAEQVANADEAATAAYMSEDERSEMEAASQERDADTKALRARFRFMDEFVPPGVSERIVAGCRTLGQLCVLAGSHTQPLLPLAHAVFA